VGLGWLISDKIVSMKVLITGANGYLGRVLLNVIENKHSELMGRLVGVTRTASSFRASCVEWVEADLSRADWISNLPDEEFDVVVHLAQSSKYREFPEEIGDILSVNTRSTVELADWARNHGVKRFIFASTGTVYGSGERISKEEDSCNPDSMYGASKLAAEILLNPYAEYFDIAVLRFFGIYGPDQANMLIPNVIKCFINGEEITLAGNVGVKFNPIYVDDAVNIVARLITEDLFRGYEIINVGGDESVDLQVLVSELESNIDKTANIRITESSPKCLVGSVGKIKNLMPMYSTVSFSEGVRLTCKSLRPNAKFI
jgi:UDP-glucose 4-epimerase